VLDAFGAWVVLGFSAMDKFELGGIELAVNRREKMREYMMKFMRKWIAVLLLFSGPLALAQSQLSYSSSFAADYGNRERLRDIHLIPTGGYSSIVSSDAHNGSGAQQSAQMQGGLLVDYSVFHHRFAVETGVMYIQTSLNSYTDGNSRSLDYVGIPLIAKMNFFNDSAYTTYFKLGVIPMFMASEEPVAQTQTTDASGNLLPLTQSYNTFDAMAVAGLGVVFPLGESQSFIVDGTYSRGLIPVVSDDFQTAFNQGFLFSLAVSFGI
jgi:hypothetical protein